MPASPTAAWYRRLAARCPSKVLHDRARREDPYLIRYTVFKRRWCALYLHQILRSDSTQDYHDHPWPFAHIVLEGGYEEQKPGCPSRFTRSGSVAFRRARFAHRLELNKGADGKDIETWTLVLIGPKVRDWGFLGRLTGCWVRWETYVFDGERCE